MTEPKDAPPKDFFELGKEPQMTDAERSLMRQWVRHEAMFESLEEMRRALVSECGDIRKSIDSVIVPLWLIAILLAIAVLKSCA